MGHDNSRIYGTHITYTITPFRQRLFMDLPQKFFKQSRHFLYKNWPFAFVIIIPAYVINYARHKKHELEKEHWY